MAQDAPKPSLQDHVRRLRDCLQSVEFLAHLKLPELDKLMEALKKRRCPAGAVVIKQGDPGDAFFMVSSGKVEVSVGGKPVAQRGIGEYFGEGALVNDAPRSATVKATTETELYVLYKDDFKKILMANPGIAAAIRAHIAKLKTDPR